MIQYRPISLQDNDSLALMIREVFIEHNAPQQGTVYSDPTTDDLYALFQTPKSVLWVAEENDRLLGCCGVYPTDGLPAGCAELVKFYLHHHARGKGIGKYLLQKSIDSAQILGYKQLYLESFPHFAKAVGMYEKLGFHTLHQPMGNSGHTACTVFMIKTLS